MNLLHACSDNPVTAYQSTSIVEAARLMRDNHVGAVVVMSDASPHRPVGIITDRDIVVRVVAQAEQKTVVSLQQVMTTNLVFAPVSMSINEAIDLMREHGIRHLPVEGTDQGLRGIVSFDDLLPLVAGEITAMAQTVAKGLLREEAKK